MEAPAVLVENILKDISKELKYEGCNTTVKQIFSGGANYGGYLFCARVSAPGKEDLKLFAKVAVAGENIQKAIIEPYPSETFFYSTFIKTYRRLEEKHDIPEEHKLRIAKFYGGYAKGWREITVLEDLTANGYRSFDRLKSVTWEQAVASIEQLAKFHALSLVFLEENAEEFNKIKLKLTFPAALKVYTDMIEKMSISVIEATEGKDKERISQFIQSTLNSELFYFMSKPVKKDVIIHGDYRPSNLMYKHENGRCKVVPLDLQTLRCGSPAFDLMYFIDFAADSEYRQKYFQATIDHYYMKLCEALGRFKVDPRKAYSREDFEYELKKIMPFTTLFGLCGLLIVTVDEDIAPKELENLDLKDFAFPPNELFKERLKDMIQFYTQMGVIP